MRKAALALAVLAALAWLVWPHVVSLDRYGVESAARGGVARLNIDLDARRRAGQPAPETLENPPVLWKGTFFRAPHPPTSSVVFATTATARDTGGWGYDRAAGRAFIDCTHTDSRGNAWTYY